MLFPVFFWYLLREASRIWLNWEDKPGVCAGEDIVMVSGGPQANLRMITSMITSYGYNNDISTDSAECYSVCVNTHRRTAQRRQTRPTSTKRVIRVSSLEYVPHSPTETSAMDSVSVSSHFHFESSVLVLEVKFSSDKSTPAHPEKSFHRLFTSLHHLRLSSTVRLSLAITLTSLVYDDQDVSCILP